MKVKFLLTTLFVALAANLSFAGTPAIAKNSSKTITVTPPSRAIAVTFGAIATQTYGAADFDPGATSSTGTVTYTSSNLKVATIVSGKIHIIGAGVSNIIANDGSQSLVQKLTVAKAAVIVSISSQTRAYGTANAPYSATYAGFVSGETEALLTTSPGFTSTASASSPVKSYPITVSTAAVAANYVFSYVAGKVSVTKAPLTIAADKVVKLYGAAVPALTATFTGFVNGETQTVLTKQPTLTIPAVATSAAGNYPININGATAANYAITLVPGVLSIQFDLNPAIISYQNPAVFKEGTPFTLTPSNTGGPVPTGEPLTVTTLAGRGIAGAVDGTGTLASFKFGTGTFDFDALGNMYVADQGNNVIRKVTPDGTVTTFAGSGAVSNANGQGTAASFNSPIAVGVGNDGNIYVCDAGNHLIRMITPAGLVSTFAGSGAAVSADGIGTAASFSSLKAFCVSKARGALNLLDNGNLRTITIASASVGTRTINNTLAAGTGITEDAVGNYYICGTDNHIWKVAAHTSTPIILAGTGRPGAVNNSTPTAASFNRPTSIAVDQNQTLYVADAGNNLIRCITSGGVVSTYAGTGQRGLVDGPALSACFNDPISVAINPTGFIYTADGGTNVIRKIMGAGYSFSSVPSGLSADPQTGIISGTLTGVGVYTGKVTAYTSGGTSTATFTVTSVNSVSASGTQNIYTIAGNGAKAFAGDGGPATSASFSSPYAMTRDKAGNIYVAEYGDSRVREILASTKNVITVAGTGVAGYSGDGGPATSAQLNLLAVGLAVDAAGNLYIADANNNRIRKVNVATHIITTVAGTGTAGYTGDGGLATAAALTNPAGVAIDASNNIYISDVNDGVIRMISGTTKKISTLPITGLGYVERMAFDSQGNLYWGDESYYTVNKFNISTQTTSIIAGAAGVFGNSGDGGLATAATLEQPMSILIDKSNNIYIADQIAAVVRKIDATTQTISTFAGIGTESYSGDGAPAIQAGINYASDILADTSGNFYLLDYGNNVVRRIGGPAITQTVTFPALGSYVYGSANTTAAATASSGLPVTYTSSNPAVATVTNGVIQGLKVGTVAITATQAGTVNYQPASATRNLSVTAAPLTITADDQTKLMGSANPTLTFTYGGFVNGETLAVVTTLPLISTTAKTTSPAGSYPITIKGAVAPNYTIKYIPGTLTVTGGALAAITSAANEPDAVQINVSLATGPTVRKVLSPNGDGINDVLVIDGIDKFPDNKLLVMNSNGQKVYEASGYDNVSKAFDGRSSITGTSQLSGTYFYLLQYNDKGVSKRVTGYFVLRR